jgi:hypothetical protein
MDEQEDLDLTNDPVIEDGGRQDNRFKTLSEKVKTTAQERDAEKVKAEKAETKRLEAEKERDFFKDFNTSTAKYPGAAEFQDRIKEKVLAGYDMEDATVSVLAKEGRLTPPAPAKPGSPAGGSATTAMKTGGEKPISEMTREEKRAAILDAESKGEISMS